MQPEGFAKSQVKIPEVISNPPCQYEHSVYVQATDPSRDGTGIQAAKPPVTCIYDTKLAITLGILPPTASSKR